VGVFRTISNLSRWPSAAQPSPCARRWVTRFALAGISSDSDLSADVEQEPKLAVDGLRVKLIALPQALWVGLIRATAPLYPRAPECPERVSFRPNRHAWVAPQRSWHRAQVAANRADQRPSPPSFDYREVVTQAGQGWKRKYCSEELHGARCSQMECARQ
jgi:hypothetical protein